MADVGLIGFPNVGKSTLLSMVSAARPKIANYHFTTLTPNIGVVSMGLNESFAMADIPGLIEGAHEGVGLGHDFLKHVERTRMLIHVVDVSGLEGRDPMEDFHIINEELKKYNEELSKRPQIVAANKIDDETHKANIYELYELGFSDIFPVSGIHGTGMSELLDKVISYVKEYEPNEEEGIKFCLLGRPNVGKSSLVNALLNEERVIVSNIPGTTRDAIDIHFTYNKEKFTIIDTAGIRRPGKVSKTTEKYSVIRALNALERSDVAVIVLDGEEGILEQDLHIAGIAQEKEKATVIVVNKWDLVEKDTNTMNEYKEQIKQAFNFISYSPVVFLSALTKKEFIHFFQKLLKYTKTTEEKLKQVF